MLISSWFRLSPYSNGSLEWDSYDIVHPELAIDSSDNDQPLRKWHYFFVYFFSQM